MDQEKDESSPSKKVVAIPVLPLRDVVVYPHMVIPLFVGREKSIKALDAAMAQGEKQILLVAQREATEDNPSVSDLYSLGSVSTILQLLKLPDGTVKVLVEGIRRGRIVDYVHNEPFFLANVDFVEDDPLREEEAEVLVRTLLSQFEKYVKLNKKIPPEIVTSVSGIEDPSRLADTIAAHMSLKINEKQNVLEISSLRERLERLMALMESEIDLLQVEQRIRSNV
ncbi:MAG: LON peptidase substrate-binding domain-containing protein, partial [Candidatus Berkiella sp.]